ncbi:Iron transport multicopper oxidase FET3 [Ceratocystis platani]|uniref:Iron transport multicopper oxidase FET3 n=1 Tax=Ceratocystis fimbriata f. sp. platani TaxID=88771 RepID=A0A0F8B330_CERFI|nr:Iron transport multicopper oxidase FET3 [Ceratocystis platani]
MRSSLPLVALASTAMAAVRTYNWDVTWVNRAPNGFGRPVVGINNQWPNPSIEGEIGDHIIVNVHNGLGNETTSLHWHGLYMTDTPHMDGAAAVSQCAIPPGQNFTYEFDLEQAGTYWWHSHEGGQYADGLRGPLIIHDPKDPHKDEYDEEYVMSVSDWYDDEVPTLLSELLSTTNTNFRPPIADSALVNERQDSAFAMTPGKKYRFRIINYSALASAIIQFGDHPMTVIETDGIPVVASTTNRLFVGAGQRYSVILEAKPDADANYPYLVMLDMNPNFRQPQLGFPVNTTGLLQYGAANAQPAPLVVHSPIDVLDEATLSPYDLEPAHDYTVEFEKNFTFSLDTQGVPRAYLNGEIYVDQKVPTLYTALTVGDDATNPVVYGDTNTVITDKMAVVQIVLNNRTPAGHPFHLHGHHFQVVARGDYGAGLFNGDLPNVPASPLFRDTVMVNGNSYVVLRYLANRPGAWIFHCHMEWHVHMGGTATFITAPLELQKSLVVPQDHFDMCACGLGKGNAAGNVVNPLDLTGANDTPMLPDRGALYDAAAESALCANTAAPAPTSSSAPEPSTTDYSGPEPTSPGSNGNDGDDDSYSPEPSNPENNSPTPSNPENNGPAPSNPENNSPTSYSPENNGPAPSGPDHSSPPPPASVETENTYAPTTTTPLPPPPHSTTFVTLTSAGNYTRSATHTAPVVTVTQDLWTTVKTLTSIITTDCGETKTITTTVTTLTTVLCSPSTTPAYVRG